MFQSDFSREVSTSTFCCCIHQQSKKTHVLKSISKELGNLPGDVLLPNAPQILIHLFQVFGEQKDEITIYGRAMYWDVLLEVRINSWIMYIYRLFTSCK